MANYTTDVGHWTHPLGLVSVIVESVLLVLALWALWSARNRAP
jgi:hypothetical protein